LTVQGSDCGQYQAKEIAPPKLDSLWIKLTSSCNLRCIHCYAEVKAGVGIKPSSSLSKGVRIELAVIMSLVLLYFGLFIYSLL